MSNTKKISAIQLALSILTQLLCLALAIILKDTSINPIMISLVCISTSGFLLCMINSEHYMLHWNRFITNKNECILFTIIGMITYGFIFILNHFIIQAAYPDFSFNLIINNMPLALPLFIIVYCFLAPINFVVVFKLLTDKLPIRKNEAAIIVISAIISAIFFTILSYSPTYDYLFYIRQFIFIFLLSLNCSYLYNQSHSLVCSALSLGFILLVVNIIH